MQLFSCSISTSSIKSSFVVLKEYDAVYRLQEIENILGDDYDLERLKELVEADKEGKVHICQKTTSNRYFAGTDENGKPIYKETDIYVRR